MPAGSADAETTYEKLKLLILNGELSKGQPLIERTIAERLGVSRTPIRETILRLEHDGLVEIVQGKGAFVVSYSIEDLVEIYDVRVGLEPVAARLSCPNVEKSDLERFEEAFQKFIADPERDERSNAEWQRIGAEFHNYFVRKSRNSRIIRIMDSMREQIALFRSLGRLVSPEAVSRTVIEEHLAIVDALRNRDPAEAERAVRRHLENSIKARLEMLHAR